VLLGVHATPVVLVVGVALSDLVQHFFERTAFGVLAVDRAVFGLPPRLGAFLIEMSTAENDIPDTAPIDSTLGQGLSGV